MRQEPVVAYFSMEVALEATIPTYAGGLGVLAGDTIRSCADLGVRLVAVTLLHRLGYFRQKLDALGAQTEEPVRWPVEELVEPADEVVSVEIQGRSVQVRAWRYGVRGEGGREAPVYLLDTDLPENAPEDRRLTDVLYGGDERHRLAQEIVLGIGGIRMLRALGYERIDRFHLNEGHAALAVLELLEEAPAGAPAGGAEADAGARIRAIRERCVFTTHTPVPAGHDRFPDGLARAVLGERRSRWLARLGQTHELNLTDLALRASRFVNGVAMRHGEVSQGMFPQYPIRSITNGIHPPTWTSASFRALFDRHIPEWRRDPLSLRYAVGISRSEIGWAHARAKRSLLQHVAAETGVELDENVLTIGFARRATAYKRMPLVFRDRDRLAAIAARAGPVQLLFAGKAHPRDAEGKESIRRVFEAREALRGRVAVTYLPDYGLDSARLLCAGCDVWLNTPVPPLEASGTSGMKAALNGVPSLSILDGWWVEGHVEGVTGWAIGADGLAGKLPAEERDRVHADALYRKLEEAVLPCFYKDREGYLQIMRYAIALNSSFFNTQRMVLQYLYEAYAERGAEGGGPAAAVA